MFLCMHIDFYTDVYQNLSDQIWLKLKIDGNMGGSEYEKGKGNI